MMSDSLDEIEFVDLTAGELDVRTCAEGNDDQKLQDHDHLRTWR
jgi:hypothetical protein